jgi:YgiT-type zinc finger domain-containing protein
MKLGKIIMECDFCGNEGINIRKVARTYGKGEDLLLIENIPVISCPHCGESYLTAATLHEIERIKSNRKSLAVARSIKAANFGEENSPIAV